MRIAEKVLQDSAVSRATLVMGTPANKEILEEAGLLNSESAGANPSDLIIVIEGHDSAVLAAAFEDIEAALTASAKQSGPSQEIVPRSIAMGIGTGTNGTFNLAQISVPGAYAGAEALKAVKAGQIGRAHV